MAAAIIHNLPDDASRRAYLSSPEMHRFWCSLKSTPHARLLPNLLRATQRKLSRARAAVVPDLFNDYLFEIPAALPSRPRPAHRKSMSPSWAASCCSVGTT